MFLSKGVDSSKQLSFSAASCRARYRNIFVLIAFFAIPVLLAMTILQRSR